MVFLVMSKMTLGDPCELSWSSKWSTLGPDWLCGVGRAARGGGGVAAAGVGRGLVRGVRVTVTRKSKFGGGSGSLSSVRLHLVWFKS